jgi:hypothetical protein
VCECEGEVNYRRSCAQANPRPYRPYRPYLRPAPARPAMTAVHHWEGYPPVLQLAFAAASRPRSLEPISKHAWHTVMLTRNCDQLQLAAATGRERHNTIQCARSIRSAFCKVDSAFPPSLRAVARPAGDERMRHQHRSHQSAPGHPSASILPYLSMRNRRQPSRIA